MKVKELSEDTKVRLNCLIATERLYSLIQLGLSGERTAELANVILKKLSLIGPPRECMRLDSEEEYEYYSHVSTEIEGWLYDQLKEEK